MDENQLLQLRQAITAGISDGVRQGVAAASREPNAQGTNKTTQFGRTSGSTGGGGGGSLLGKPFESASKHLEEVTKNAGGDIKTLGTNLAGATPIISEFKEKFGGVIGYAEDTQNTFRSLSRVGAGLEGRLGELRSGAADTRMSMDQFANMVGNNSELLSGFAGGVTGGIQRFRQLSKAMMEGDTIGAMLNLGYSLEGANEFILKNMEVQRREARFRNADGSMNSQLMLQSSLKMAESLDVMAKVAGKDLKQMQDDLVSRQRNGATQARLRLLEQQGVKGAGEAYRSAQTSLAAAPQVAKDLVDDLVQTGVPMSKATQIFASTNKEAYAAAVAQANAIKRGDTAAARAMGERVTGAAAAFANSTQGLELATKATIHPIAAAQAKNLEEVGPLIDQIKERAKQIGEPLTDTASYIKTFNDIIKQTTDVTSSQKSGGVKGQELSVELNAIQLSIANSASLVNDSIGKFMTSNTLLIEGVGTVADKLAAILKMAGAGTASIPAMTMPNSQNPQTERNDEDPSVDPRFNGNPPRRALGGPVNANRPYRVGEQGEETFIPGMDGAIIPNMKNALNKLPDIVKQLQQDMAQFGAPMSAATQAAAAMGKQSAAATGTNRDTGMDGSMIPNIKNIASRLPAAMDQLQQDMAQSSSMSSMSGMSGDDLSTLIKQGEVTIELLNRIAGINTTQARNSEKQLRSVRSAGNLMIGIGRA